MTAAPIDFPINQWGDDAPCDPTRTLRAFYAPDAVTVVDAMAPGECPRTVFLTAVRGKPLMCSGASTPDEIDGAEDSVISCLCDEMRETRVNDFCTVYSRAFFVIRVDFDVEDGSIEVARDVSDDFAQRMLEDDDYFDEDGPYWGGPDHAAERSAYMRNAL